MLKVLHIGTLDARAGGPAMSTYLTIKGLRQLDVDAEMFMPPLSSGGILKGKDVPIYYSRIPWERKFLFTPQLKKDILAVGRYDIYHAQGIWQYPTYALIDVARSEEKPYIITPRGMLYPQDIAKSNSFIKKKSLRWRLLKDLNDAACVHVTCKDEMMHCRRLGVTSPIAIIPNPVEVNNYQYKKEDSVRRVGYLGRISRRKNVEGLITAFYKLGNNVNNAELLIIGGGDEDYERMLHNLVCEYHLNNVRFVGFLAGEEKDRALASCSVLAMPSEFENLGNVVLEGLVRKIPCIATQGSPWEELNSYHCGWWVPYTQENITNAVKKALEATDEELGIMGENGRNLIESCYNVPVIAAKMKELYLWVLGETDKPDFVYFI